MVQAKKTLVINFFAGPGAGKTTCAWEISAELKKRNIVAEYTPEYAKELVWDEKTELLNGCFENQLQVFAEQKRRLDRLIGKVEVIVADSPLLLQAAYVRENIAEFEKMAVEIHNTYENFNLFINRGRSFEQAGRIHSLTDSIAVDHQVKAMLERNNIYYGNYCHETTPVVVNNIRKTLSRLQGNERPREEAGKRAISRAWER